MVSTIVLAISSRLRTASAHNAVGLVTPPVPAPAIDLTLHDGTITSLPAFLTGYVTAVQLMFTRCQATCPLQGSLFAAGARKLGDRLPQARWLSISIDPAGDDPPALRGWLSRFGPHPRWWAARPDPRKLEELVAHLKSSSPGPDPHTGQAYFFDRRAALVARTDDLPPVGELLQLFEAIAGRG